MSHLSILTFKYNLAKLRFKPGRPTGRLLSARDRQPSDLMMYKPDDEEMKKVFNKIAGEPGRMSKDDLQVLLQRFGKTDAAGEARRMICAADYNKDGYMDLRSSWRFTGAACSWGTYAGRFSCSTGTRTAGSARRR